MSHPIITVKDLSKRYVIGHQSDSRDGLRHAVEIAFRNPFKWFLDKRKKLQSSREEFWALRNVSFEIEPGDAVGIIGRNGAGKSTLLKVLSRITEPTSGQIRLKGRVASLLEVGTGFHQELTGRENIYLNGAILGMSRVEIKRKFDEIVAFSEVEKFLDTPVKRYSSGMYVRLAFAVAAHLEPEILIVDEVLAVGDSSFQKKCLGKMGQVAKGGRTVLFVSHNMGAMEALCSKAIYLQAGKVEAVGAVGDLVGQYLSDQRKTQGRCFLTPVKLGNSLTLLAYDFTPNLIESGKPVSFRLTLQSEQKTAITELQILIYTSHNVRAAVLDLRPFSLPESLIPGETWEMSGEITSLPFVEGDYSLGLYLNTGAYLDNFFDLTTITVRARATTHGIAPYPIMYRGLVELPLTINRPKRSLK